MSRRMYAFRLPVEAGDLIAAWAAQRNSSQADLLIALLVKVTPPSGSGESEAKVRAAHKALVDVL